MLRVSFSWMVCLLFAALLVIWLLSIDVQQLGELLWQLLEFVASETPHA